MLKEGFSRKREIKDTGATWEYWGHKVTKKEKGLRPRLPLEDKRNLFEYN